MDKITKEKLIQYFNKVYDISRNQMLMTDE